ncbi:TPA: hypothetical protein N0F65_006513 [Lagenidium giganteum]|uniref:NADH-ubiquinone reductase complex 1 MLRQ subunit n=1 Tax=Lagenidium giganteum TaxID=4803 RepID=A0AAV2YP79_9STRA|nr:TPA: hypothetical protein N0F65_012862 [Lagenidium giganteum]DAZ96467.1 TPA: hypothetical protein N0F65_006513 [Lagenidium giganteum]
MVASRAANRSGISLLKLWLTDRGTFPVVLICSGAAVAASCVAMRTLFLHPDVCIDKSRRESTLHHEDDVGRSWRQFRFRMANIKRNPINQSHQFDDLFAKPENQSVKR